MKTFERLIDINVCTGQIYCFQFKVRYNHEFKGQETIKVQLEAVHMGHINTIFNSDFECSEAIFAQTLNQEIEKLKIHISSTFEKRFTPNLNEFDKELYKLGFKEV